MKQEKKITVNRCCYHQEIIIEANNCFCSKCFTHFNTPGDAAIQITKEEFEMHKAEEYERDLRENPKKYRMW